MKNKSEKKMEITEAVKEAVETLDFFLCVRSPFRSFNRGDLIHDAEAIKEVLGCHEAHMVNKVLH